MTLDVVHLILLLSCSIYEVLLSRFKNIKIVYRNMAFPWAFLRLHRLAMP